jgi:hypothetical protein
MTAADVHLEWRDVEASLHRLGATDAAPPCDLVPAVLQRLAAAGTKKSAPSLTRTMTPPPPASPLGVLGPWVPGGSRAASGGRLVGPRPAR